MPLAVRRALTGASGLAVAAWGSVATAGTIRHDVDPSYYTGLAQDPAYQSVGQLEVDVFVDGQPAVGSATLVGSDWVVTAAHVLDNGRNVRFNLGGQTYSAARWATFPKYTGDLVRGFDIAMVQLDQPVAGITPAGLYRKKNEFNRVATFVGYGRNGNGLTGVDESDTSQVKRAGTNVIDGQLRRTKKGVLEVLQRLNRQATTYAVDFDNPANPLDSRLGSSAPTALEYLISKGDSGGGVFIDDPTGEAGPLLAGIHSFGEIFDERDDSDYGDLTGHTRVSKYARWIDKVMLKERYRSRLAFQTPSLDAALMGFSLTDASARSVSASAAGVPEPAGLGLLLAGGAGLLSCRRRRRPQ